MQGKVVVITGGTSGIGEVAAQRLANMGARIVVYGSTGGPQFTVNAPELFLKNLALIGSNVGNLEEYKAMLAFVEQHRLRPVIDRAFAFKDAAAALQYLATGHRFGKVTIVS